MTWDELRAQCLSQPKATEDMPFGPDALVFKVAGKMFALLTVAQPGHLSLKVDPLDGEALRAAWPEIAPGYHLNKRHWITVDLAGSLPDALLETLVQDSYRLVVAGLPRAIRQTL